MPSRAAGANYQLLREVDHLQELVGDLAAIMRTDGLLPSIARAAARLCQTPLAAISLLSKDVQQLELVSVVGTAGLISEKMLPIEGSLNGMVIDSARPFYSADVWHDPRSITRAIALRNKTRAVLIVPLAPRAGLTGTLVVANREPRVSAGAMRASSGTSRTLQPQRWKNVFSERSSGRQLPMP